MSNNSEERARAVCAVDAQLACIPATEIPALVERLWPVAALEISGGVASPDPPRPSDLEQRMAEYHRLRR